MNSSLKAHIPTISVVIPVLNNRKQLVNCLNSILKNSFQKIDIIVIDGGSSDGSLSVIKEYSDHISYWESGRDSGIADAFNRGISKAKGELIAILNSDDYWANNTIHHIVQAYKQAPNADVFYGKLNFIRENLHGELEETYIIEPDIRNIKYRMTIFHPAMFVRRAVYNKIGLYRLDFTYAMDSEWCHRALKCGVKFHYVPNVLATMRLGGISDREFKQSLLEYRRSVILNKLASPFEAGIYYYFFLFMKSLMQYSIFRKIKHTGNRLKCGRGC